jgi:hypothetical protein
MAAELTPEIEKSLDWLFSALDGKLAAGVPARILDLRRWEGVDPGRARR